MAKTPAAAHPPPRLRTIAPPLFLELGLGLAVGLAGTLLASRLSDAAAAGFALSNNVFSMLFVLFRIIGAGIGVVVAQALGAGRPAHAAEVARAVLGASSWVGAATALAAAVGAAPLLRTLNAPADVLPLAAPLLRALAPVLLLDAWNASLAGVLRAHLKVRPVLVGIVTMHATHLVLALLLMPALGLVGFALAMLAGRAAALAANLWLWRTLLAIRPRRGDWWRLRPRPLAAVLRIGLPGAAENIAWRACFLVSVAVAGRLGGQALATHAYTMQIVYFVLLAGLASGLAVEIVVGHLVGAARLHAAHRLVRRALGWGLLISVLVATCAALLGPLLLRRFSSDPAVVAGGTVLLWLTVLVEPGRTFNLVLINALRAAGDARYPVAAGVASMVIVLAGGSWLLGHALGLGLVGVWIAYAADEWLRGLLMWRRWATQRWVPHARAARRRLRCGSAG